MFDNLTSIWSCGCQVKGSLLYSNLSIFAESFKWGVLRDLHYSLQWPLHVWYDSCQQCVAETCRYPPARLHNIITQKTVLSFFASLRTSYLQHTLDFPVLWYKLKALEALCVREQNKNCWNLIIYCVIKLYHSKWPYMYWKVLVQWCSMPWAGLLGIWTAETKAEKLETLQDTVGI